MDSNDPTGMCLFIKTTEQIMPVHTAAMQAAGHNMLVLLQAYMEPSLDGAM